MTAQEAAAKAILHVLGIERLPARVDEDLPGGRWCDECGIRTNHTGAMHRAAEAAGPQER